MRSLVLVLVLAIAAVSGCGYNPDLGGVPFACGMTEPRCPEGYSCQDNGMGIMNCYSESGGIVDAPIVGFQCNMDGVLETSNGPSNDTIQTAYATPVQQQLPMISFAGIAICPEGDKDTYVVNITTANADLEVIAEWESGMPISVSILGSGGATLGNSMSAGPMSQRAYVANLPVGSYYAQAYAAANVKNNYKISIKTSP